jgi:hypothetical protein
MVESSRWNRGAETNKWNALKAMSTTGQANHSSWLLG